MHKLHPTPIALNFIRGGEYDTGTDFSEETHYFQFDGNSIITRPIRFSEQLVHNIFSWHLLSLQEFTLGLRKADQLTNLGFQTLWCQDWAQFTHLKALKLSLSFLSSSFRKNPKNLQNLIVMFRESNITLEGAKFLILSISKHLKKLESLC